MTGAVALAAAAAAVAVAAAIPADVPRRRLPEAAGRQWRLPPLRGRQQLPELASTCHALAAELEAGSPPQAALAAVAAELPPSVRAAVLGIGATSGRPAAHQEATPVDTSAGGPASPAGPAGRAPRPRDAERQQLLALQVVWGLSASSGAGLALLLRRLGASLAEEVRLESETRAALAGVRASAAVVAALPVIGLLLGALLGGSPLGFLLTSPVGWGCLLGGLLLEAAGLVWLRLLVRSVR